MLQQHQTPLWKLYNQQPASCILAMRGRHWLTYSDSVPVPHIYIYPSCAHKTLRKSMFSRLGNSTCHLRPLTTHFAWCNPTPTLQGTARDLVSSNRWRGVSGVRSLRARCCHCLTRAWRERVYIWGTVASQWPFPRAEDRVIDVSDLEAEHKIPEWRVFEICLPTINDFFRRSVFSAWFCDWLCTFLYMMYFFQVNKNVNMFCWTKTCNFLLGATKERETR